MSENMSVEEVYNLLKVTGHTSIPAYMSVKIESVVALITERERAAELRVWEQVAVETRAVVCECGQKWSETDLGIRAEKRIALLQHPSPGEESAGEGGLEENHD